MIPLSERVQFELYNKGWKYDFTKCANKYPGPGQYLLPSKFDKFDKKK